MPIKKCGYFILVIMLLTPNIAFIFYLSFFQCYRNTDILSEVWLDPRFAAASLEHR